MVRPVCCEVGVANNIGWRRLVVMGGANHVCVYLAETGDRTRSSTISYCMT